MFPYTAEVLAAAVAGYNADYWLAAALAPLVLGGALWLAAYPKPGGTRLIGLLLAAAWAWVGGVFHLQVFSVINFMAPVYALMFLAQAGLLLWLMAVRRAVVFERTGGWPRRIGVAFALFALVGQPIVALLLGGPIGSVRLAGVAPGPTALLTLALLIMTSGRASLALAVIPMLWCAAAGATGLLLGVAEDQGLVVVAAAAGAALIATRGRPRTGV